MATLQSNIVCDSSTLTNFKAWAQAISTAFSTFGWTQSSDTGQVNWSSIAAIPTGSTWAYEIWQPSDALTTFYVKVEYGNNGTTNSPSVRLTLGTTTNGSGTITGLTMGPYRAGQDTFTAPSSTTQYECNFSGSSSRIGVMLWRNGINNCQQFFGIERALDTSGAESSTSPLNYVTLFLCGQTSSNGAHAGQRSLHFTAGAGPDNTPGNQEACFLVRPLVGPNQTSSGTFNSFTPFDTAAPNVGFIGNPQTVVGCAGTADITEGVSFSVSVYGATRTYMPAKAGPFASGVGAGSTNGPSWAALCMRYD